MAARYIAVAFVGATACSGGSATPRRHATPQPVSSPAPDPARTSAAVAERERACEEEVHVRETLAECRCYGGMGDDLRNGIDARRTTWANSDTSSIAWQELLRDECLLSSSVFVETAVVLGCPRPVTPELDAWQALPVEPELGTARAECARATEIVSAFRACSALPKGRNDAGGKASKIVALSKRATTPVLGGRTQASRCRHAGVALARLVAEAGCGGV